MKKLIHVVITGGHHNSALVVAKELIKNQVNVSWIGHRRASAGDQNDSAEYLEVKASGITFHNLTAGKFSLHHGIINLLNIPLGVIRAAKYLQKLKPTAVISFGGYLGFAVSLPAYILGIPIYLHEQTVTTGLANRLISYLSRRIFLTWESSLSHFPRGKAQVIGLPLRESVLNASKNNLFENRLPTLLIMGGKQGSHIINKLINNRMHDLLSDFNVIHQTGTNSTTHDYEASLACKDALPKDLSSRYRVEGYIGESEIGTFLKGADYYLGRSGAHITYEIGIVGLRSVFIPYMHTTAKEQLQNARMLASAGLAVILPESELSYPRLVTALKDAKQLVFKSLDLPRDAAKVMVQNLLRDFS